MKSSFVAACLIFSIAAAGSAAATDLNAQIINGALKIDPGKLQKIATMPMAMKSKGCTVYEHENGGGASLRKVVSRLYDTVGSQSFYAEYVPYVGDWWNDRISSYTCDETADVDCFIAVYPDANKGGQEGVFASNGLTNFTGRNRDRSRWNDIISSFTVYCMKVR